MEPRENRDSLRKGILANKTGDDDVRFDGVAGGEGRRLKDCENAPYKPGHIQL